METKEKTRVLTSEAMLNSRIEQLKEINLGNHLGMSHDEFPINSWKRPVPIDKEINLDPNKTILSKTDAVGNILYANEYFVEISGYEEYEIMGRPHSIIRHPDMPKAIFKLMWDSLLKGENIYAFIKNLAKDGRYYWVLSNFEIKYDERGNIIIYYSRRKAAPRNAIQDIDKLYKTLKAIEIKHDMETSLNFFNSLLEDQNMTFNQFTYSLLGVNQDALVKYFYNQNQEKVPVEKKQKGLINRMFM